MESMETFQLLNRGENGLYFYFNTADHQIYASPHPIHETELGKIQIWKGIKDGFRNTADIFTQGKASQKVINKQEKQIETLTQTNDSLITTLQSQDQLPLYAMAGGGVLLLLLLLK